MHINITPLTSTQSTHPHNSINTHEYSRQHMAHIKGEKNPTPHVLDEKNNPIPDGKSFLTWKSKPFENV
jgi:hypothetical protein